MSDVSNPSGRTVAPASAALFVLVLVVFLPALRNGFIDYDDNGYVTHNAWVQAGLTWQNVRHAFTTTEIAYWHPLTWVSHLLDVQLYGLQPWGHHLTSVLFHALNTVLVFLVFWRTTGAVGRSWMVAALFGVHPLHVESVAWVAERKDVLSTFFLFVAIASYVAWVRRKAGNGHFAWRWSAACLGAFAAGLMSKPMVVTFPFILLLLDYWPLARWPLNGWRNLAQLLLEKLPFFALSAIGSIVTVHAQSRLGTVASVDKYAWTTRLLNAALSYFEYLGKCFVPVRLAVFYPYRVDPPVTAGLIAIGALVVVTIAFARRRRVWPFAWIGWLWFLGTLVPVIGLVQVGGQAMADRYSYVPLIGIFVVVVWGVESLAQNIPYRRGVLACLAGAALIACSALAIRQIGVWRDGGTLFRHAIAVTHDNATAHVGLGYFYSQSPASLADAVAEYREAVRLSPRSAEAHQSLGALLLRTRGGLAEAVDEFETAVKLNPRYFEAYVGLGAALEQLPARRSKAAEAYAAALRLRPENSDMHNRLGDLLSDLPGRADEALAEFRTALKLAPGSPEIRLNIGRVLAENGRWPEAIAEYTALVQVRPDFAEAHNNLANALGAMPGRTAEALGEYETALRLRADYVEARFNYATLLASLPERHADAIRQLEVVLRQRPDFEPARELINQLRGRN